MKKRHSQTPAARRSREWRAKQASGADGIDLPETSAEAENRRKREQRAERAARKAKAARYEQRNQAPPWLPDWRREDSYPHLVGVDVTPEQWAWEFIRRNPTYQQIFASIDRDPSRSSFSPRGPDDRQQHNEDVGDFVARMYSNPPGIRHGVRVEKTTGAVEIPGHVNDMLRPFGLTSDTMRDPRETRAPRFLRMAAVMAGSVTGPQVYNVTVLENELWLRFDLTASYEPQAEALADLFGHFVRARLQHVASPRLTRKRQDALLSYLRVLDARAVPVSFEDIDRELRVRAGTARRHYARGCELRDGQFKAFLPLQTAD